MSFVNVTSGVAAGAGACCAFRVAEPTAAAPASKARPKYFPNAIAISLRIPGFGTSILTGYAPIGVFETANYARRKNVPGAFLWEQNGRPIPLRNLTYWYTSNNLQSCSIHGSYAVVPRRGHIGHLAV